MSLAMIAPLDSPNEPHEAYGTISAAITALSQPGVPFDLDALAADLGTTPRALADLFKRWCGLSPKSFAQAVALDHARKLLRADASVLDTSYAVGLSGPSRLHDLFVTYEAVPPGIFRARGAGLDVTWGVAPSPFGVAVLATTPYGLAGIAFADSPDTIKAAFEDLAGRWPNARYQRQDAAVADLARRVFDPARWDAEQPVRLVLIGSQFEVKVWHALLAIRPGTATTYGAIAQQLGTPQASRAVGRAVGRNPISFVVPCHRVVGSKGALTGYHWGVVRKRAMMGWEAGLTAD